MKRRWLTFIAVQPKTENSLEMLACAASEEQDTKCESAEPAAAPAISISAAAVVAPDAQVCGGSKC
jgi:hypothetical protein